MAAVLLVIPGIILTITCLALVRGWAISMLWNWFLVPLGLPLLGVVHAIGIGLVLGVLVQQADGKKDDREAKEFIPQVLGFSIGWVITVGIGWIVQSFM
jgi:hypothetical protein